jgi:hypothetical protein
MYHQHQMYHLSKMYHQDQMYHLSPKCIASTKCHVKLYLYTYMDKMLDSSAVSGGGGVTGRIERITQWVASWFALFAKCPYGSKITEDGRGWVGRAGCIARNAGIISAVEMLIGKQSLQGFFRTSVEKEDNIRMNNWKLAVRVVWPAVRTC